jgi:hypothetical protein
MRPLKDGDHAQLREVLAALVNEDVDVSVREVARRHPTLRNASAFTRSSVRMALINEARQRQDDARRVKAGPSVRRAQTLAESLESRTRQVDELETRVRQLVASHAACIHAVMLHGGMSALERFWSEYKHIADGVQALGAMPGRAEVVPLKRPEENG